jgi:hypothetical protein
MYVPGCGSLLTAAHSQSGDPLLWRELHNWAVKTLTDAGAMLLSRGWGGSTGAGVGAGSLRLSNVTVGWGSATGGVAAGVAGEVSVDGMLCAWGRGSVATVPRPWMANTTTTTAATPRAVRAIVPGDHVRLDA